MLRLVFLSTISVLLFFVSCNSCSSDINKEEESSSTLNPSATDSLLSKWDYENDSGKMSVIFFNEDGDMQYVVDKPENLFTKLSDGLEYKIVEKHKNTPKLQLGDVLYLDMFYRTELTDSLLFNSNDLNQEFRIKLNNPNHKNSLERVFLLLNEKDSVIVKLDAISFYLNTLGQTSIPAFINKGERLIFNIRIKKVQSGADYVSSNKEVYQQRITEENSLIERFLLDKHYPIKRTDSGLTILTISKGTGANPKPGNHIKIDYTAAFIDGGVFDSTLERSEPFSFQSGQKQVIIGLEEAIMNMNVGDHCLVIIPFRLAYGDQKYGNVIPPFSTLVFEIELLDAK